MGVIRPPWVDKDWFTRTPFNYCDHFGDQKLLATVCKVCKQDLERQKRYRKEGKNPHDLKNVLRDVGKDLALTLKMVAKQAEKMGIDLNNLPEEEDDEPPHESFPIFNTVKAYASHVEKTIKNLEEIPVDTDTELVVKAVDALSHSRHYVIAKTARALSSRHEEQKDPDDELDDSKTSAFFAYIAIERNSRALMALAHHKPLDYLSEKHLKLARTSLGLCEALRAEFFPKENLTYQEFGYIKY